MLVLVPNPFDDYNFIAYFNFAHSESSLTGGRDEIFFLSFIFSLKDYLIKISFPMQ